MVISGKKMKRLGAWGEWCVVGLAVMAVCALFSLPTVVYLSKEDTQDTAGCEQQAYSGVCRDHLLKYQTCGYNGSTANSSLLEMGVVYIPSDQANQEDTANATLLNLTLLGLSPECEKELAGLICLHLFGVCTDNGKVFNYIPIECVLDETQNSTGPCDAYFQADNKTDGANATNSSDAGWECSPTFYRNEEGLCVPECAEWQQFSDTAATVVVVVLTLSASVHTVGTLIVLVVACIKPRKLHTFPSILLLYEIFALGVTRIVTLISYTDQKALYCSNQGLIETITEPTLFCHVSGGVNIFMSSETQLLWMCHTVFVLWGIQYPFHARRALSNHKKARILHITTLLLTLILSAATVTAALVFGDLVTAFPPIGCTAGGSEYFGYFVGLLPPAIYCTVSGVCLVLILWLLVRSKHKHPTATKKVIVLLLYFLILVMYYQIVFAVVVYVIDDYQEKFMEYLTCESLGSYPNNPCRRSDHDIADRFAYMSVIADVLAAAYPIVILLHMTSGAEWKKAKLRFTVRLYSTIRHSQRHSDAVMQAHSLPNHIKLKSYSPSQQAEADTDMKREYQSSHRSRRDTVVISISSLDGHTAL